jgi:hypothetical protein
MVTMDETPRQENRDTIKIGGLNINFRAPLMIAIGPKDAKMMPIRAHFRGILTLPPGFHDE